MRIRTLLLCVFSIQFGVSQTMQATSPDLQGALSAREPDVRPVNTNQQGVTTADARAVMLSTADQIWRYFPEDATLAPLEVELQGGPIVLYDRGTDDEYRVRLDVEGRRWNQLSYQFAHEFCHILCRYDRREHPNKWFEESLCEAASIFALKGMGRQWETDPPFENWAEYAPFMNSYADQRIEQGLILVDGVETNARQAFLDWFADHRDELAKKATDRSLNSVAAVRLWKLLEASPEDWAAVAYLNVEPDLDDASFEEYLSAWRKHCPEEHRAFVDRVAEEFGLAL